MQTPDSQIFEKDIEALTLEDIDEFKRRLAKIIERFRAARPKGPADSTESGGNNLIDTCLDKPAAKRKSTKGPRKSRGKSVPDGSTDGSDTDNGSKSRGAEGNPPF